MRRPTLAFAALALLTVMLAGPAARGDDQGGTGIEMKRSADYNMVGHKKPGSTSGLECSVSSGGANTKLDCDDPFPNNEPDIEVDPADPNHMVASSNDYGTCCDQFYTTFDGGQTWQTGNMSNQGPTRIGSDPVTVFDTKHGTVIHPSLSFKVSGKGNACDGDLVVSVSHDGGLTWKSPVLVADGVGCDNSRTEIFNDKEWIVTDNNPDSPYYGRAYLTWTEFFSNKGAFLSSPIFEAHSDDGGLSWTAPREISGSSLQLCTYQTTGPAGQCDENQFSVGTVRADGTVFVAFENEQNTSLWEPGDLFEDQYLVVQSSDGGQTWSDPAFAAGLEDGSRDYPTNVDGRQTVNGYQVRLNSAGNIVASPLTGRLFIVFSDNRNGVHDSDTPVTNLDVFIVTSTNGTTWSKPARVDPSPSDQWFPWAEVNPVDGTVGVIYNDRSTADPSVYNATFAHIGPSGIIRTTVSTEPSHPTDSIYFDAGVPGCEECATFNGDYINVSYGSDGVANLVWTDMRDFEPDADAYAQFIYFARL